MSTLKGGGEEPYLSEEAASIKQRNKMNYNTVVPEEFTSLKAYIPKMMYHAPSSITLHS